MFDGRNLVYVLGLPINIVGAVLTLGGLVLILRAGMAMFSREVESAKMKLLGDRE